MYEDIKNLPRPIDRSRHYLFYLHGEVLEDKEPRAVGYDYPGIRGALAARGFIVISQIRPSGTTPEVYGGKVANDIATLIREQVSARQIAVAGFSKGAAIAIVASALLRDNPEVNFVIMAGCWKKSENMRQIVRKSIKAMKGRVLSLYHTADKRFGSCGQYGPASTLGYQEVPLQGNALPTGDGHQFFFAPRTQWVDRVARWAKPPR